MARMPIDIGPLRFATKAAATEHFRAILNATPLDGVVDEPHASELDWLLDRHPEVDMKRGAGVARFRVVPGLYGTRCFAIERVDGTGTDFSYLSCIDGKASSPLQEMLQAMRAEVQPDIMAAKRRYFAEKADEHGRVPCALTGAMILFEDSHADHAPPRTFSTLAIAFLKARRIVPDRSQVTAPADNQMMPRLIDPAFAADWREYHHEMVAIRVVARRANLERNADSKVRKKDRQLNLC